MFLTDTCYNVFHHNIAEQMGATRGEEDEGTEGKERGLRVIIERGEWIDEWRGEWRVEWEMGVGWDG